MSLLSLHHTPCLGDSQPRAKCATEPLPKPNAPHGVEAERSYQHPGKGAAATRHQHLFFFCGCMYTCVSVFICVSVCLPYECVHVCVFGFMYMYACLFMYLRVCRCTRVACLCAWMYACIWACGCMYEWVSVRPCGCEYDTSIVKHCGTVVFIFKAWTHIADNHTE